MALPRKRPIRRAILPLLVCLLSLPFLCFTVYDLATPGQGSAAMKASVLLLGLDRPHDTDATLQAYARDLLHRAYPTLAPIPKAYLSRYVIESLRVDGLPVMKLRPKLGRRPTVIIFMHGGAYTNAASLGHWWIVDALARDTGATVLIPIYPLAPEHDNRTAWPFLTDVYVEALRGSAARDIVLAGDSAGGGLVLGEAMTLRDEHLPSPARLILFSPWVDATLKDPTMAAVQARDPILTIPRLRLAGQWWAGADSPASARVSPLFANLSGLPPVDIFQGTDDLFIVTSRDLSTRLRQAGVGTRYFEYPGAFHDFVAFTLTPEANDAFRKVSATLAAPRGGAS